MRAFLLCLALAGCSGGPDATDAPLSDAELNGEITAEAERINSCETVDDCEAKAFGCSSLYVNADADQTRLDELLAEHAARRGDVACPGSCACGVLLCDENKCVTEAADCMTPPPDGTPICL